MKPYLIIMSGLPGCGKSTFIDTKLIKLDPFIISRDDIVQALATFSYLTYNEIFKLAPDLIDKILLNDIEDYNKNYNDHSVIWDQTHISAKIRAKNMSKIQNLDKFYKVCIQFMPVDYEEAKPRLDSREGKTIPEHVYQDMHTRLEKARYEEGFDSIITVGSHDGFVYNKEFTGIDNIQDPLL